MWMRNRRNEREIKAFLSGNALPKPDERKKRSDMALFREMVRELPERREKKFPVLLWEQAAYVHPVSWAVQLMFVLCGFWLAKGVGGEGAIMGISAMVPLFAVVGGFELSKTFFYHMWELERSCRYDTRKIAGMKLFLFGMCDMAVLTVFSLLVCGEGGGFMEVCLLVLVPFNLSMGIYLFAMERFPVKNGNMLLLGLGCVVSGLWAVCREWAQPMSAVPGTAGAWLLLAVSLLFLAGTAVRFYRGKDREDEILWNLN